MRRDRLLADDRAGMAVMSPPMFEDGGAFDHRSVVIELLHHSRRTVPIVFFTALRSGK